MIVEKQVKRSLLTFYNRLFGAYINNLNEKFPVNRRTITHNFLTDYPEYQNQFSKNQIYSMLRDFESIWETTNEK